MSSINPAVPGAKAAHFHGVPATVTATTMPGTVLFDKLPPLHIGDFWFVHYVPEWESAHPTVVTTGIPTILCDKKAVAASCVSNVTCGQIVESPIKTTILKP